jgi:hypothetical protein
MAISEDTANACAEEAQEEDKPLSTEQGGNMDKIRDILFGAQMREYETRFVRLEESLLKESADLRDTAKRRFDALESYVKKEMEALQSRVKAERDERSDFVRRLSRDLSEASESLSKRIGDLDERTSQAHGQLRDEILQQSKDLNEEIRVKQEEISDLLEKRFQELRNVKTDRAALATLFHEVALRLKDEFKVVTAGA